MALDFLNESPADKAEATAVETGSPPPEPKATPEPAAPEPKAEPAAPTPAPAVKAAEPAKPEPKQPFVSHAALHEERQRRQALEAEVAALRAGKTAEPPKEIDPETDPIAALKEVREFQSQQREQAIMAQQLNEFDNRVRTHEGEWAAANPDYTDHITFLREFRAGQIKALFPGITDQQLGAQLMREARETAFYALQNGKNPGEVFSDLARHSGWKAKEVAPAAPAAPLEPAPDPAIEARKAESEAALERISRGQKAARGTAGAGANEPDNEEMTVEKLSKLNGAAFDKAMEKHGKRLFGG